MTRRLAVVVTAPRSTVSGYVICIRSMCDGCFVYDVRPTITRVVSRILFCAV